MRRAIKIVGIDKELELGKVVEINTDKNLIYFEEMKDCKWRLTYSKSLISDFKKVKSFEIIRED